MRILIVDDEPDFLAWEKSLLEADGHEVFGASSGTAALRALDLFRPELVFLDILLPDLDGHVGQELIQERSSIPVVLVSALAAEGESVLWGASGFVRKPPRPDQLLDAVRRHVRKPSTDTAILIVDDDESLCRFYRTVLEMQTSFQVLEAYDGKQALAALEREPRIRLVVTDVHMPEMNGLELVRAIRADPRWCDLPILVQTSDSLLAHDNVWAELHVERALEKEEFRTWLRETVTRHKNESGEPGRRVPLRAEYGATPPRESRSDGNPEPGSLRAEYGATPPRESRVSGPLRAH